MQENGLDVQQFRKNDSVVLGIGPIIKVDGEFDVSADQGMSQIIWQT
jgi:hypothetical protein